MTGPPADPQVEPARPADPVPDEATDTWDGTSTEALRLAWDVPYLEAWTVVGSTNDRGARLARAGAAPYSVVVADLQTAGRGRRGARWTSPAGAGLLLSLTAPAPVPSFAYLPLLVGLAAAEAIERTTGSVRVGLKWPNDLLVEGRKVGGVLCEAAGGSVVIGLGVNVRAAPPARATDPVMGATALDVVSGNTVSRSVLAGHVVAAVRDRLRAVDASAPSAGHLPAEAYAALQSRDALVGRALRSESGGPGIGRGLAPDGALLLERPDGETVAVRAGSVRIT